MKFKFLIFLAMSIIYSSEVKLVNFSLKDLDKKKVNIQDFYKNGPILVNFWNLACEPCKKEMKFLNEFDQKYENYGFNVISVNMDTPRSLSKVKSYIKSKKYTFTVLSDPRAQLFRKSGGSIMPYTLLVDKKGTIINKHTGYNLGDEINLEKEIIHILGIDSLDVQKIEK
tara:strand:- start:158 stop:667 length:510 start_codon:yes stop_codon:yes gene_type:complete